MNDIVLINLWYVIISLLWIFYISQELFVSGSGIISYIIKNKEEKRQIQVATGIHWDGIQVWLIAAITFTFAAFPVVYARLLEYLYIIIFLLLYTLITRALSIELIYKKNEPIWQKRFAFFWALSSFLLMAIFGIYFYNLFAGYEITNQVFDKNISYLFSLSSTVCAIMFISFATSIGALWVAMRCEGEISNKITKNNFAVAAVGFVSLLITFFGLTNKSNLFKSQLYTENPILFIIPSLSVGLGLLFILFVYKKNAILGFFSGILTIVLFLFTGFIGTFPYILGVKLGRDKIHGIDIYFASATINTLNVLLIVMIIFFPLAITYQVFKYIKFRGKIKINDKH